jgi:leucyl aminopeptidase
MFTIAKLAPDVAVTGYMACVENGIGAHAYHPGDVIKSRKGLTVEINNTDAEGRLILADALDYAQSRDKADVIIDLATLTGACMVALGPETAAVFSDSEALAQRIISTGKEAGEDFWRLPLNEALRDQLKSSIADMKNTGDRFGGSITGALFLKKFVSEKVEWAHLDIAGPASLEKDHSYTPKGGAGFAVRTLVSLLCDR